MKVGDKIICPAKPEHILSGEPSWENRMTELTGTVGTICHIDSDGDLKIKVGEYDCWWYAARWFNEPNIKENELILLL